MVTQMTWKASTGLWQGLGMAAPRGWAHTFLGDPPPIKCNRAHIVVPSMSGVSTISVHRGSGARGDKEGGAVQSMALSPGPAGSPELGKGDRKNLGEREYEQAATLQKPMDTSVTLL